MIYFWPLVSTLYIVIVRVRVIVKFDSIIVRLYFTDFVVFFFFLLMSLLSFPI